MKKFALALTAALLLSGPSVAKAQFIPADVTWRLDSAPAFTFDTVVLTPYLEAFSSSSPGGRTFTVRGFLDMSEFLLDGVPAAIPGAGFPGGNPYSVYLAVNEFGLLNDSGNGFLLSSDIRMLIGPVATFTPTSVNPPGQLNPLAVGTIFNAADSPPFSVTPDPVTGEPVISLHFFAALTPLQPPFIQPFWISPVLFGLDVSINGNTGTAFFPIAAPEPNRYAMLLLGLCVIGLMANRRRMKKVFPVVRT